MSTDSFNLAPGQHQPAGAITYAPTPAPAPATQQTPKKRAPKTDPNTPTLAGAVIPGAALTGFIGLCWLIHQFGLPAVLLGVIACATAATAALAMKGRKGKQSVSKARKAAVKQSGGGGPGRSVLSGGGKRSGGGALKGATGAGKGGGRTMNSKSSGLTSSGMGKGSLGGAKTPKKNPLSKGGQAKGPLTNAPKNKTPKTNSPLSRKSAALGGGNHAPNSKVPTQRKNTPAPQHKTPNGRGKHSKATPAKTGRSGLLSRIKNRKTPQPPTKKQPTNRPLKPIKSNTVKTGKKTPTPPTTSGRKTAKPIRAALARKLAQAAKSNTLTRTPKTPKSQHLKTKSKKTLTPKKTARLKKKGKKAKLVKNRPTSHTTTLGRMRRTTYLAGTKLRKHTSKKTRMRIRRVISPARTAARRTSNLISPPLAFLWRHGTRGLLAAHMALGTIRYTHAGPNWVHPLAAVFHTITSPAARLVHATGSWTWLNRWMYQHTAPKTVPVTTPAPAQPLTGQVIPPRPTHAPVFAPSTTAPKGTPVSAYAAPLQQAADAVRQAGIMLVSNPAENMVGYEATLNALADVQAAISEVLAQAGSTTRENFKVNPAVAEAYDDSAGYAGTLASRVGEIPTLFRTLHEEQIENIENPTVQARKWDIAANE
ncbi:hypothetical protein [Streptomyces sp. NPDC047939]|uniref:hypothetical protein n=1 Tax=Streptomyces sp. NPDC047939 TaxID=3155381 RepID=UPI003438BAC1